MNAPQKLQRQKLLQRQIAFHVKKANESINKANKSINKANVFLNNLNTSKGSMFNYMNAAQKDAKGASKTKKPCRRSGLTGKGRCRDRK